MNDKIVTSQLLKRRYTKYAPKVLMREYLEPIEDSGKGHKYKLLKPLPTKEEFLQLQTKHFTTTVDALVSDAFSAFEELAGEMRDWYDNLPQQFQDGDKGCALEEAASTLEGFSQPDVPDEAGKVEAVFFPQDGNSRSDRCSEAKDMLETATVALREKEDEEGISEELKDEVSSLADELENISSEAESIEFPGMYG